MFSLIRLIFASVLVLSASANSAVAGDAFIIDTHDELTGERELYAWIRADRKTGYTNNIFTEDSETPYFIFHCGTNGFVTAGFDFSTRLLGGKDILGNQQNKVKFFVKFNDGEVATINNLAGLTKDGDSVGFVFDGDIVTSLWLPEIKNLKKLIARSYSYWEEREITFFVEYVPPKFHRYVNRVLEGCN